MKVDRAQIECIIVWPEAGQSAIGCAVSCNTIAKGPLSPSHAGDIERICRELRKVQSAEKTADKTRSEPPGIQRESERENDREETGKGQKNSGTGDVRWMKGRHGRIGRIIEWYVTVLCRFARNVGAVSELMAAGQMFRGFSAELSCPWVQHNARIRRVSRDMYTRTRASRVCTNVATGYAYMRHWRNRLRVMYTLHAHSPWHTRLQIPV